MKTSHLDAVQGSFEQRSETYKWYFERVAEKMTLQCAKSNSSISGWARKQGSAVRRFS